MLAVLSVVKSVETFSIIYLSRIECAPYTGLSSVILLGSFGVPLGVHFICTGFGLLMSGWACLLVFCGRRQKVVWRVH